MIGPTRSALPEAWVDFLHLLHAYDRAHEDEETRGAEQAQPRHSTPYSGPNDSGVPRLR